MKVYIITKQPFPYGMASTNRIICFGKAIVSQNIHCEVLIFTRTEICEKEPRNIKKEGYYEGIAFQYMGRTPIRDKNPFIRKFYDLTDQISLAFHLLKNLKKNDIVFSFVGRDVKYINCLIKITHLKKAKFIRELCELPYGTGKETSFTIKNRHYLCKTQFPKCDGIIAISDTLLSLAEKYTNKDCKLIKIPILVDFEKYKLQDNSQEAPIPYIFHSGTLYEQKDGILGMLEAFGQAVSKLDFPIKFISTGRIEMSPHKNEIKKIISKYHIEKKVIFTGYVCNEELKDYLSKASLVIINKYPNQQNTYCFSTKLGEYLAAGKPVIITKVGEAINWLENNKSAYIIEPNNINSLADTIIYALNDSDKRKTIAINGQNVCKQSFDYNNYSGILSNFFKTITNYL